MSGPARWCPACGEAALGEHPECTECGQRTQELDVHTHAAANLFRKSMSEVTPAERRAAKNWNYSRAFGGGNLGEEKT